MAPEPRFVPRFAAEPPQETAPYGRWAEVLEAALREAVDASDFEDVEFDDIHWFPDRTWHGRTYVPATARTTDGREVFGLVSFHPAVDDGDEPESLRAIADVTDDTSDQNPEWTLDLCDEALGAWRGEHGATATMTLVWGVPMVPGGAVATAELADLTVDQCLLTGDGRFTLLAPDDYRGDLLDIKLWNIRGEQLASESLYAEDGDEDDEGTGA
jgi:hypothetical protein